MRVTCKCSWLVCLIVSIFLLGGCKNEPRVFQGRSESATILVREPAGARLPSKERLRSDSPSGDDEIELSIVLNPAVALAEVPEAMHQVVGELVRQFPGLTFTAVAYMPTSPLKRVGRARFDAETGTATFQWDIPESEQPVEDGSMRI